MDFREETEWTSYLKLPFELIYIGIFAIFEYASLLFKLILPSSPKCLNTEVILITGSSNGIGREITLNLAKNHPTAKLILWDCDDVGNKKTAELVKDFGAKAYVYKIDISDRLEVERIAAKVSKDVGDVTIIINNAGIAPCHQFLETLQTNPGLTENVFKINVLSQFWILREFLPKMVELGRGHIVTMCSVAGLKANRYMVPYHGSKFAIHGYLQSLQDELRHHPKKPDIKFTTVYPTAVNTKLMDGVRVKFRFSLLTLVVEPEYVAKRLIDGLRRNQGKVYCPPYLELFILIDKLLPDKARVALTDFLMPIFEPESITQSTKENVAIKEIMTNGYSNVNTMLLNAG